MKPLVILEAKKKKNRSSSPKNAPVSTTAKGRVGSAPGALKLLKKNYPNAHCALIHKNSFELLIATILSAQCTDERVNIVTKVLFKKFPNSQTLARASAPEVEEIIRSTGFYKNKAKSLLFCSRALVEKFHGEVPQEMESLIQLAGVGRKTANVVLGNSYGIVSGVVVDTHVGRLSLRLGWTQQSDPIKVEQDLMALFPKAEWIMLSHYLIFHGRNLCKARSPQCERCFLFDLCPKNKV